MFKILNAENFEKHAKRKECDFHKDDSLPKIFQSTLEMYKWDALIVKIEII